MSKFLGNLRVIVEADDWNDAFDMLDELLKPHGTFSIRSASIDSLTPTRRMYLPDRAWRLTTRRN